MGVLKGVTVQANLSDLFVYFKFALFHWLPLHLVNVFAMIFLLIGTWILIRRKVFTPSLSWIFSAGLIITLLYYVYEINMIAKVHDYYMLPFLVWLHLGIAVGIRSIDWAKSRFLWQILLLVCRFTLILKSCLSGILIAMGTKKTGLIIAPT